MSLKWTVRWERRDASDQFMYVLSGKRSRD